MRTAARLGPWLYLVVGCAHGPDLGPALRDATAAAERAGDEQTRRDVRAIAGAKERNRKTGVALACIQPAARLAGRCGPWSEPNRDVDLHRLAAEPREPERPDLIADAGVGVRMPAPFADLRS